jgi:hypothetical protein
MREKKFTAGAWKVVGNRHVVTDDLIRFQKHICFFPSDYNCTDSDKSLISAAPELLEACESMLFYLDTEDMRNLNLNKVRAAIAKAYGETQEDS